MSVINKVLRDLDSRAATSVPPPADAGATGALTRGTASVAAATGALAAPRSLRRYLPWATLVVLGLALAVWWLPGGLMRAPAPVPASLPPAAPGPTPTPAPVAVVLPTPVPVAAPQAVAAASIGAASRAQPATVPPPAASPRPALPAVAARPASAVSESPARPSASVASAEVPATEAARPRATTKTEVVTAEAGVPLPVWQDAAMDAVAQAQRMWNAGTRDAAVEFLRDAMGGVERAHGADLAAGGSGAVAGLAMVRELVRMELVQGQHAALLAVLKRHERLWSAQAELWAVRANAAQRLSLHAESGQAYLTALKIRPGEPRWMLGAAVSLAAQGQVAAAADLAEQARALAPVSPDILAYLRQLGVPLR